MIAHHLGKMLSEAQRKQWMQLLLESADEVGLPDDPEFRSAFIGYLEWGSRLAIINSNEKDNPVTKASRCQNGVGVKQEDLIGLDHLKFIKRDHIRAK